MTSGHFFKLRSYPDGKAAALDMSKVRTKVQLFLPRFLLTEFGT